jgi:arylsulfatase A-like enzyme
MNLPRMGPNRLWPLACAVFGCLVFSSFSATPPAHPNIIFILTDDLGWGDLGVFFQNGRRVADGPGRPSELTPHLDQLAAEGVQLRDHYCAAPVCAPSRASILLGVSQGHANVRDNQFDKALEDNHTLATVLRRAGYATVAVGKWGLQGNEKGETNPATWPAFPTKRGFDAFFGYARHADGHEHYPKEALYTKNHEPKQVWDGTNDVTPALDKCYTADLWTAWAKHWIVEHERTNSSRPFFMYLAYDTPHAVTELPTQAYPAGGGLRGGMQWLGKPGDMISTSSGRIDSWIHPDYRHATYHRDHDPATPEVPWPDVDKRYATAVRRIDDAVGDIEKLLRDLKMDGDTVVIFSSDNGPSIESYLPHEPLRADFFDSFGPFDGIKRDCWEGGERVPTVAWWPGHIRAGGVVTRPSISYDWLRTFAELAGVPSPARADGVSLLPELTGEGAQRDRGYIYMEYFEGGRTPNYPDFAPSHRGRLRRQMQVVRLGDYVGVRYNIKSQADPFEIYQLPADPKETNNLAAAMPTVEEKMKTMVLQVRRPNESAPRPYDDEFVPAGPAEPVANGVRWQAYEGDYPWVPDFEMLKPIAFDIDDRPDLSKRTRDNNIGMFFTGFLNAPRDGDYTFYLTVDTGALLRIHDATVIDADFGYVGGREVSGGIRLRAGLHSFRLYYARGSKGAPSLKFAWSGPGIAKEMIPGSAFRCGAGGRDAGVARLRRHEAEKGVAVDGEDLGLVGGGAHLKPIVADPDGGRVGLGLQMADDVARPTQDDVGTGLCDGQAQRLGRVVDADVIDEDFGGENGAGVDVRPEGIADVVAANGQVHEQEKGLVERKGRGAIGIAPRAVLGFE